MLGRKGLFLLVNYTYMLAECSVDEHSSKELSVNEIDTDLIARKRLKTMDMCRLFNEETEKFKKKDSFPAIKNHRRVKRGVNMNAMNPALNEEDTQRVESIVDKMYDDLVENGEKVKYRRVDKNYNITNNETATNSSSRRHFFAPHQLLGPEPEPDRTEALPYPEQTPRWKLGIVPYFIDPKTYDTHLAKTVMKAFAYFEKETCIRLQRLREKPVDRSSLTGVEWVYITNPTGIKQCVHSNDKPSTIKGIQMMVLGYNCMSLGDIVHEVMHVIGLPHEHIRPDRDQYITVLWENIKPGYRKYFEKDDQASDDYLPYDYASILHYPPRAFSKNGQATIISKSDVKIGQRESLSELDKQKISRLYSSECLKRNRDYLTKTCPSVVKESPTSEKPTRKEIDDYFSDRLWHYAIVNYLLKDQMEFTLEEKENIKIVINHIERETCIEFRDLTPYLTPDSETTEEETDTDKLDEMKDKSEENEIDGMLPASTENEVESGEIVKLEDGDDRLVRNSKKAPMKRAVRYGMHPRAALRSGHKYRDITRLHKYKKHSRPISPSRRHATSILKFNRSVKPGCDCPPPGAPNGVDTVAINADCFNSVNMLLHLFVHVLGLDHQHNSHDRDSYLHIEWDNLTEETKQDMENKLPLAASVGFPYDYQSVMHFPWLQIKDGRSNIMYPIWNDGWAMGHWQGLSEIDIQKLNQLYRNQCKLRREHIAQADALRSNSKNITF